MGNHSTLDDVVLSTCMDIEDMSGKNYELFLHYGKEFLQKYNRFIAKEVVTKALKLNAVNQVAFPEDMVDWAKIGTRWGDKIKVFSVNDRTNLTPLFCCGEYQKNIGVLDTQPNKDNDLFWFYNYQGEQDNVFNSKGFYGYGTGYDEGKSFRVDLFNKVFQFSSNVNETDIIIEYISNGLRYDGNIFIAEKARYLMRDFILSNYYKFKGDLNMYQVHWENYKTEHRNVRHETFKFTIQDILKYSRANYKQSPTI